MFRDCPNSLFRVHACGGRESIPAVMPREAALAAVDASIVFRHGHRRKEAQGLVKTTGVCGRIFWTPWNWKMDLDSGILLGWLRQISNVYFKLLDGEISKDSARFRQSFPPSVRLAATVRFLASGDSFTSLTHTFEISKQSNPVEIGTFEVWSFLSNFSTVTLYFTANEALTSPFFLISVFTCRWWWITQT